MRIGIGVGGSVGRSTGLEDHIREIEAAERDGFDSVWIPHIRGWDALTVIAIAGTRTRRIEMMTGVVPAYTRHPVLMAQQALTTQAATVRDGAPASTGRLALGIADGTLTWMVGPRALETHVMPRISKAAQRAG